MSETLAETIMLKELRKEVEQVLLEMRRRADNPGWVSMHPPMVPVPSHHEVVQTYLLLRILEKLEEIESSVTTLSNDSWEDHHNK